MVRLTQNLTSTRWIYAKGMLFILLSLVAGLLILIRMPQWDMLALLLICVWASCRAYYFAFYVIEHYVDPGFRFSGLFNFVRYLTHRDREHATRQEDSDQSA